MPGFDFSPVKKSTELIPGTGFDFPPMPGFDFSPVKKSTNLTPGTGLPNLPPIPQLFTQKKLSLPVLRTDRQLMTISDSDLIKISNFWFICRYNFKHIFNNIYVPITNIQFKSKIKIEYRESLSILKFYADSWFDIFEPNNKSQTCNYVYSILITHDEAIKLININIKNPNYIFTWNLMSGTTYYSSNDKIKKIYPDDYNFKIKIPILMLLNSTLINNKKAYDVIDTMYKLDQDVINLFINNNIKITNLYGVLTKKDIDTIIIFYKLFSDYGANYDSSDIKLENIKELIEKTCNQLSRCVKNSLYQSYSQIICNKRLVAVYIKKLQFFYKYFINANTENVLASVKKRKILLNEIWQVVKYGNKKNVYNKTYMDNNC